MNASSTPEETTPDSGDRTESFADQGGEHAAEARGLFAGGHSVEPAASADGPAGGIIPGPEQTPEQPPQVHSKIIPSGDPDPSGR